MISTKTGVAPVWIIASTVATKVWEGTIISSLEPIPRDFNAINKAEKLLKQPFIPCKKALNLFDQDQTFKEMAKVILN